jgi:hypothetical protein
LIPELGPLRSEPLERGDQLWREGRREDALRAYTEELDRSAADHFTRGMAHKRVVALLAERDGIDAAFAHYQLTRIDDRDLTIASGEVLLCATVQDEAERLPFFLDYYERLGVDRFLIVDNDSHDATRAVLLDRPNVHLWASGMRYWRANYGMAWIDVILYAHGRGHWCVVVDIDEHLWYPGVEHRDLHELCHALDEEGAVAMQAVLLDMYSETAIRNAACPPGSDPAVVCGYFDRRFSHAHTEHATPWSNIDAFWGGVRRRVFGAESDVFLSKVPLVRYSEDTVVLAGTHGTAASPETVASERGALLHFKFTSRFVERLEAEIRSRSEWDAQGESYSTYSRMIAAEPDLTLYDPRQSVALRDSTQLVEVGVMRAASANGDGRSESVTVVDDYIARMHDEVPGWFTEIDASLFRAVDAAQRAAGVRGDLLEVGVYLGKSAVLLGYLLRPDEELIAWDLFSGERLAGEADAQFYLELTQEAFEANYARYHERPATTHAGPSSEIPGAGLGRRFRFVHVDGSHRYEIARDDIAAALELVVDGGILVVDDYRTVPHALGVAAAVWEAVTAGRLVPVLASDQKLYGFTAGCEAGLRELLRGAAHDLGAIPGLDLDVAGHAVTVFSANAMTTGEGDAEDTAAEPRLEQAVEESVPPSTDSDEVAELRRRLDLIENSRTWRLRAKLARLLPTRR